MLRNLVIALVVFSVIVMGSSVFIGQINEDYNTTINETFNDTLNSMSYVHSSAENMSNKVDEEGSFDNSAYGVVSGSGTILKMMFGSLSIIKSAIYNSARLMGVPLWFAYALITIAVITFVSLVIGVLFRRAI